jgi:hypothetical protein
MTPTRARVDVTAGVAGHWADGLLNRKRSLHRSVNLTNRPHLPTGDAGPSGTSLTLVSQHQIP